jgi:hypothetical protein
VVSPTPSQQQQQQRMVGMEEMPLQVKNIIFVYLTHNKFAVHWNILIGFNFRNNFLAFS